MNAEVEQAGPSFAEFVIIISLMMSLAALSIDAVLPALPQIGSDLNVQNPIWLSEFRPTGLPGSIRCIGNLNSLAMKPLGHIAGIGAAVVGSLSSLISVPIGVVIGRSYDGTVVPLIAGMAILAALSTFVVGWVGD